MKSIPFSVIRKVPMGIRVGEILDFVDGGKNQVTRINTVEFIDTRTMKIIGLCKPV